MKILLANEIYFKGLALKVFQAFRNLKEDRLRLKREFSYLL
jgi:hypothetical protein